MKNLIPLLFDPRNEPYCIIRFISCVISLAFAKRLSACVQRVIHTRCQAGCTKGKTLLPRLVSVRHHLAPHCCRTPTNGSQCLVSPRWPFRSRVGEHLYGVCSSSQILVIRPSNKHNWDRRILLCVVNAKARARNTALPPTKGHGLRSE